MKRFLTEFQNRFNKFDNDNDLNSRIEHILSLRGRNDSLQSVINSCINAHVEKLQNIKKNTPIELKHCMESYKLNKISEPKRSKIKQIVIYKIVDSIHDLDEKHFQQFFDRLKDRQTANELRQYATEEVLPILSKHALDIEFELDRVITDYNNNTTNFWGRNKDKIIVPIVISIVTTLLTIFITKLLGW